MYVCMCLCVKERRRIRVSKRAIEKEMVVEGREGQKGGKRATSEQSARKIEKEKKLGRTVDKEDDGG